jgi:hypothetical protein
LPAQFAGYKLHSSHVSYFRSYLVLNSIYFLSTQNILKLDLKTEAIIASYRSSGADQPKSARLLEIRYEAPRSAVAAFRSFVQSYLPERNCQAQQSRERPAPKAQATGHPVQLPQIGSGAPPQAGICLVEDGWVGYRLAGRTLVLAFQLPSEEVARLCLDEAAEQLNNWEKSHD